MDIKFTLFRHSVTFNSFIVENLIVILSKIQVLSSNIYFFYSYFTIVYCKWRQFFSLFFCFIFYNNLNFEFHPQILKHTTFPLISQSCKSILFRITLNFSVVISSRFSYLTYVMWMQNMIYSIIQCECVTHEMNRTWLCEREGITRHH